MIKTSIYKGAIVINSVEAGDTLGDISEYWFCHIGEWTKYHVMWDVNSFNFVDLDPDSIRNFIEKGKSVTEIRSGLKTALVVESDIGFGMMRMFQMIADGKAQNVTNVFRSKEQAFQWFSEEAEG